MIYLKAANMYDWKEEYKAIKQMPANENGFENKYYDTNEEEFKNEIIPKLIEESKGIGLPDGWVPCTYYFLWDDDKIVGLFKLRHHLNEALAKGGGHVGYAILADYRGKGYATEGLKLSIEECKKIIPEDEIYLSVRKDNKGSLKVQKNNGAYIVDETDDHYLTRIKIR